MKPNIEVCRECRRIMFGDRTSGDLDDLTNISAWMCPPRSGLPPYEKDPFIYADDEIPIECTRKMEQAMAAALPKVVQAKHIRKCQY